MSINRPLILLTNDDGIYAEGLRRLQQAVSELGDIIISAPESQQSAVGHSITLYDPIRVHEISVNGAFYGYGISGTPADAVKLAVQALLPRQPDVVLSGINNGANLGFNVLYSGTVSAATEAAILNVPGIAFSFAQKKDPPFRWAIPHVTRVTKWVLERGLPAGVALSVNIPALPPEEVKGYKLTRQGISGTRDIYDRREDPRGNLYFWLTEENPPYEVDENVDTVAIKRGYVSITPLFNDLTAHSKKEVLAESLEGL
jgi:5'-nucleotidase